MACWLLDCTFRTFGPGAYSSMVTHFLNFKRFHNTTNTFFRSSHRHFPMTRLSKTHPVPKSDTDDESNLTYQKSQQLSKQQTSVSQVKKQHELDSDFLRFIRYCCCSMSTCTAFGFISMVILISLIVWLSTFISGYVSTSTAIESLRKEIKTTALNQLDVVLRTPMNLLRDQKAMVEEVDFDIATPLSMYNMARQMTRMMYNHREVDLSFFLQYPNGNYLRVVHTDQTKKEVTVLLRNTGAGLSRSIQLSASSAEYISVVNSSLVDKISGTDWYQQAIFADQPLVTVLHEMHEPDNTGARLGFTYTLPLFQNNTLQCVFGADLGLNNIGLILQKLRIGKTGSSFLMQRTGTMIATSSEDATLADGSGTKTHAFDASLPVHSKIARILDSGVTIDKVQDGESISFDGYVADVYVLDPTMSTGAKLLQRPWLFVTALPLFRDFTQVILWSTLVSLLVTVLLIALISVSTVLLYILIFVRPLRRLIKDLESVQSMQLDNIKERRLSVIFETRELQKRFYKSVHYLRLFKQFLPQSLLDAQVLHYSKNQPVGPSIKNQDERESLASGSIMQSSKHTRHSSNSGSNSRKIQERAALSTFEIGVREIKMAMLAVHLLQASHVIDIDVDSFCRQHSTLLSGFISIVRIHKGTVERFDEKFMVASFFNMKQAAAAAVEIKKKLMNLEKVLQQEERHQISFSIGLSWGLSCVGVLGCDTMRANKVFGKSAEICESLALLGKEWPAKIFVDNGTFQVMDTREFVTRPICILENGASSSRTYEIINSSKVNDAEWLYERQEKEKISAMDIYRNAFTCIEKKKFEEAKLMLDDYLKINADDAVALRHLQHIQEELQ